MHKLYHNDQADIAEEFLFRDEHTTQLARLAFFKINSYKLSLVHAAFCMSKEELTNIIKSSLLNYSAPSSLLAQMGFFEAETEN